MDRSSSNQHLAECTMKLAVIPPISILPWAFTSDYQLMLPQLLGYSRQYRLFYKQLCKDPDQYVILDNGAAEGVQFTNAELVELAEEWQPNELVLPDILRDGPATVERVRQFFNEIGGIPNAKLGVVAAGKDHDEAVRTILDIMEDYYDLIDVIYVPRSLVEADNKKQRLNTASSIHSILPDYEIHFLGCSKFWVHEVQYAAELGFVRGVDTSAPFNFARYGAWVGSGAVIERPPAYFQLWPSVFPEEMVNTNINTMRSWTNGFD